MIKRFQLLILIALMLMFTSCDVLKQVSEMQMLSKCEFRVSSVTDTYLAGVNLSAIQSFSDIKPLDLVKLTSAAFGNNLPLSLIVNLDVKNPNNQAASLNRIEWKLFIDDLQMIEGTVNDRFVAGANQTATLPLSFSINLKEVLKGEKADKLIDFATGLADGTNQTNRVMLRLKPSVMVGQRSIMYPGYIDVRNVFVAQ
ncbi:MAG: hypothetical protein U1C46_03370 [Bacteroidales bacterium]|nr:hypothetical protein [Bacteroidales bacterium]